MERRGLDTVAAAAVRAQVHRQPQPRRLTVATSAVTETVELPVTESVLLLDCEQGAAGTAPQL